MTLALAPASLTQVLTLLQREANDTPHVVPQPSFAKTQGKLIAWANRNWASVDTLKSILVSVSGDQRQLNAFLRRHGELRSEFDEIERGSVGIASVFRASITTAGRAANATITRFDEKDIEPVSYRGFELPAKGVEFFRVLNPGEPPLVRIPLDGGYFAWLVKIDKPTDVFWAIEEAESFVAKVTMIEELAKIGTKKIVPNEPKFSSVRVPAIEVHLSAELDWLKGMQIGHRTVAQAVQSFRLETPGLPRAAKSLVQPLATLDKGPLQFRDPFLLFITENNVPIGVVYASTNCWERIG